MVNNLDEQILEDVKRGIEDEIIRMPTGRTVEESYSADEFGQMRTDTKTGTYIMNHDSSSDRPLAGIARTLCHVHNINPQLGLEWLELGHGQGVAASEASLHGMIVDSVGRSPLAPRIQPHLNLCMSEKQTRHTIGEAVYEARNNFFTVIHKPFIRRQFIGDLADQDALPQRKYIVANDLFGPMHYSVRSKPKEVLVRVLDSLQDNGCLIIDPCMDVETWQKQLKANFDSTWRAIYDPQDYVANGSLVIFGKENPVEKVASKGEAFSQLYNLEERIMRLWKIRKQDLIDADAAVGDFGPVIRLSLDRYF